MQEDYECIELKDSSGVVRLSMGLFPNGLPYIALNDKNGLPRIQLSLNGDEDDGGYFCFMDPSGQSRIAFSVTKMFGATASFGGTRTRPELQICAKDDPDNPEEDICGITSYDRYGNVEWSTIFEEGMVPFDTPRESEPPSPPEEETEKGVE